MYVLTKDGQVIGYYDSQADVTAALVEEYEKEDGVQLAYHHIGEDEEDGKESEIRY